MLLVVAALAQVATANEWEDVNAAYKRGDHEAAFNIVRSLAEQGNADAQAFLGWLYRGHMDVPKNEVEAVRWYRKAAEQGHAEGKAGLGDTYLLGLGDAQQDDAEAAKWYRKAAEQGSPEAQFTLGELYRAGRGVQENHAEVVKWYREAAKQGHVSAQHELADMFMLRKAADAGSTQALFDLAWRHGQDEGEFVPSLSHAEGVKWIRKTAEQDYHVDEQFYLCAMYFRGDGVPKDDAEAAKWCRKVVASEWANAPSAALAQGTLGIIYAAGRGVPKDYVEAEKWFRKAAEQGVALAQFYLGYMYATGQGVPQDDVQAYAWYNIAAAQGDEEAEKGRNLIAETITSGQRNRAQGLAQKYWEKYVLPFRE